MSVELELLAEPRNDVGKGASRRLRRAGRVPAIIYGAGKEPENLSVASHELNKKLSNEAFYSQILDVKIGSRKERAVLRDLHRHPYKPTILHLDLQRVSEDQQLRVLVPLHFVNEDICRGVKQEGGTISHLLNELEISCLPKDLPEYLELDVADLGLGESLHLSDIKVPEGVEIVQLSHDNDPTAVNVHHTRTAEAEEAEQDQVADEDDVADVPGRESDES